MNQATKRIVSILGVVLAFSGIDHGVFEIMQGSTPTNGMLIRAIGSEQIMWEYGGEEAFTILPNFLITGIMAILISIVIMIWSLKFLDTKYGAAVFGLLFVLLFLFGGGIAVPVLCVPFVWGAATRINKPLKFWRKVLPEKVRPGLAKIWPYTIWIGTVSLLIGMFIAITGYVPGVRIVDTERILTVDWIFVFGGGWAVFLLTIVSGFADDIEKNWKRM